MNNKTCERPDENQRLLTELDERLKAFQESATDLMFAENSLKKCKGYLNEQQYAQRLEHAVVANPTNARGLVQQQQRLRCLYQSSRLALKSVLVDVKEERKNLAQAIGSTAVAIEQTAGTSADTIRLGSKCLESSRVCDFGNQESFERLQSLVRDDPTKGSGEEAMESIYKGVARSGVNAMSLDTVSLRAGSILGPILPALAADMQFVPLSKDDPKSPTEKTALCVMSYRGAKCLEANDILVDAGRKIMSLITMSHLGTNPMYQRLSLYQNTKANLNEAQFIQRLEKAASAGDQSQVESIERSRTHLRIAFLESRAAVNELAKQLSDHVGKLIGRIDPIIHYLEYDPTGERDSTQVLMNNVITADAVASGVQAWLEKWGREVESTAELYSKASEEMRLRIAELRTRAPYNTCLAPGATDGEVKSA